MPQYSTNSYFTDLSSSLFMTKEKHSLWTAEREPDETIRYIFLCDTCAANNLYPSCQSYI